MPLKVSVVTAVEHLDAIDYETGLADYFSFGQDEMSLASIRETIENVLGDEPSPDLEQTARDFLASAEQFWQSMNWAETTVALLIAEP